MSRQEVLSVIRETLSDSCELLGEFLAIPEELLPVALRNEELLSNMRFCFLCLYLILSEKSEISEDLQERSTEEIADYFIAKQVLPADDKHSFMFLADVYNDSIRWPDKDFAPDEEKILEHVDALYKFIQRMIAYDTSQIISDKPPEATL